MSRFGIRSRITVGVTVLLLGTASAIIISDTTTQVRALGGVAAPSSTALGHYAIFRREAVPSDELPAVGPVGSLTFSEALTRKQSIEYPEYSQWASIEGDDLCVIDRFTPASSPEGAPVTNRACNSVEYLESHHELISQASFVGSSSSTPPAPGLSNVISGLAPDGVTSVTLGFTDGSQETVRVQENGFIYSLGNSPKRLAGLTWTDSGQTFTENN